MVAMREFEPGITWLWVRHSTAELPRFTMWWRSGYTETCRSDLNVAVYIVHQTDLHSVILYNMLLSSAWYCFFIHSCYTFMPSCLSYSSWCRSTTAPIRVRRHRPSCLLRSFATWMHQSSRARPTQLEWPRTIRSERPSSPWRPMTVTPTKWGIVSWRPSLSPSSSLWIHWRVSWVCQSRSRSHQWKSIWWVWTSNQALFKTSGHTFTCAISPVL